MLSIGPKRLRRGAALRFVQEVVPQCGKFKPGGCVDFAQAVLRTGGGIRGFWLPV